MVLKASTRPEVLARHLLGFDMDRKGPEILELLALLAPAFPTADLLAFDARQQPLQTWGKRFAEIAASSGFALTSTEPLLLRCVVCEASVRVENPDAASSGDFLHHSDCQYDRVLSLCSRERAASVPVASSPRTCRLKTHVREQLGSTKGQVALEFGFAADVVCTAMAKRFLQTGEAFANAGALVDSLTDFSLLEGEESGPIIDGVAAIVSQKTPSPEITQKSLHQASAEPHSDNLRTETCALLSRTLCHACRSKPLQFVVMPCSHLALCEACVKKCTHCPKCRQKIISVIRTYRC